MSPRPTRWSIAETWAWFIDLPLLGGVLLALAGVALFFGVLVVIALLNYGHR